MDANEAISRGSNEANVKSRLKTSIAKITAARGDLKLVAITPAAAQPISRVLVFLLICNNFPKLELAADAESMAGLNNPTEPPKPTVKGAVISGKIILLEAILPSFFDKANRIEGIAGSNGFFEILFTKKYTNVNPITGKIKYILFCENIIVCSNNQEIPNVRFFNKTEISPAIRPTIPLKSKIKLRWETRLYFQIKKRLTNCCLDIE